MDFEIGGDGNEIFGFLDFQGCPIEGICASSAVKVVSFRGRSQTDLAGKRPGFIWGEGIHVLPLWRLNIHEALPSTSLSIVLSIEDWIV